MEKDKRGLSTLRRPQRQSQRARCGPEWGPEVHLLTLIAAVWLWRCQHWGMRVKDIQEFFVWTLHFVLTFYKAEVVSRWIFLFCTSRMGLRCFPEALPSCLTLKGPLLVTSFLSSSTQRPPCLAAVEVGQVEASREGNGWVWSTGLLLCGLCGGGY